LNACRESGFAREILYDKLEKVGTSARSLLVADARDATERALATRGAKALAPLKSSIARDEPAAPVPADAAPRARATGYKLAASIIEIDPHE
jgi:hypothetical protein